MIDFDAIAMITDRDLLLRAWPLGYLPMRGVLTVGGGRVKLSSTFLRLHIDGRIVAPYSDGAGRNNKPRTENKMNKPIDLAAARLVLDIRYPGLNASLSEVLLHARVYRADTLAALAADADQLAVAGWEAADHYGNIGWPDYAGRARAVARTEETRAAAYRAAIDIQGLAS